jgi:hypothetical protein
MEPTVVKCIGLCYIEFPCSPKVFFDSEEAAEQFLRLCNESSAAYKNYCEAQLAYEKAAAAADDHRMQHQVSIR